MYLQRIFRYEIFSFSLCISKEYLDTKYSYFLYVSAKNIYIRNIQLFFLHLQRIFRYKIFIFSLCICKEYLYTKYSSFLYVSATNI